ncbi:MAG TPA: LytTR family DNA-binding domain-containing protein [Flavitalea sp.]|nr:LytTR family DNA-binding domain-containing protein [Flavitalea sp.]
MLNCLIIDDEPIARKGLKEYIQDVEFLHFEGEFDNPIKSMDAISNGKIDLLFLDIQMPKISGMEFLRSLRNPPLVIFTTAYPQFAVDGFELNAVDYLLKPFSFERFLKAVLKARQLLESAKATQTPKGGEDYFFIKSDNRLVKIYYHDVLFAEALQNYVAIHTKEKKFITYLTFKSVEEHLPADSFLKIHKSYIISLARVDSIEGNEVRIGPHSLPISRTSRDEIMEKLLQGKFLKR